MEKIHFNINNYVWVKLTDLGKEILKKNHDELQSLIDNSGGKCILEFNHPETNENGYSKFQLWALMAEFGNHLYLGCIPPFEPNILFEVKDEKGKKNEKRNKNSKI